MELERKLVEFDKFKNRVAEIRGEQEEIERSGIFECTLEIFNRYAAGGLSGQHKMMQKTSKKMSETLAHGYSSESTQRKLSNGY